MSRDSIESPDEYDALWDVIVKDLATSIARARWIYRMGYATIDSMPTSMSARAEEEAAKGTSPSKGTNDPSDLTGQVATAGNKMFQRRKLRAQSRKRDHLAKVMTKILTELEELGDEAVEADREEPEGPDLFRPEKDMPNLAGEHPEELEESKDAQARRRVRRVL